MARIREQTKKLVDQEARKNERIKQLLDEVVSIINDMKYLMNQPTSHSPVLFDWINRLSSCELVYRELERKETENAIEERKLSLNDRREHRSLDSGRPATETSVGYSLQQSGEEEKKENNQEEFEF